MIVGSIVLLGLGLFGAMALTGGDSGSTGNVHTMPGGSIMTGPMTGTGGMHTMEDGSIMDNGEMQP